jgi:hypothetical protein
MRDTPPPRELRGISADRRRARKRLKSADSEPSLDCTSSLNMFGSLARSRGATLSSAPGLEPEDGGSARPHPPVLGLAASWCRRHTSPGLRNGIGAPTTSEPSLRFRPLGTIMGSGLGAPRSKREWMQPVGGGNRCAWCGATLDASHIGSAIATVVVEAGRPDTRLVVFDGTEIHRCERPAQPE